MINVENIQKKFGDKVVIEGISAQMRAGQCSLIIGASGSGKTVLMKCMVGLLTPDQGSIYYNGNSFTAMDHKSKTLIRKEIGMLFQGSALFDSLTVEENIMFPLNMFTKDSTGEKLKRVNTVLDRVNLSGINKKYPAELSGGMKKRVALARAIVLNPKYLFCDEPNSGLDPQTSLVIDKLIRDLTLEHQITTVINTHDMNSVMEIGDYILFMHQGKKDWEGTRKEIIFSKNQQLNDFIFASEFLKDAKDMRMLEETGKIPNDRDLDQMIQP
ncbi:MAG: ATP-binding cassette domain-containing protein [Bacteroidetes bacterium]|nr:ATP-binding cassette domain-containing protein [Bacteroidota bacterium]